MGEQIAKEGANPILVAILNFFLGGVGYFLIGQKTKGIWGTVVSIILWILSFVLGILIIPFVLLVIWNVLLTIDGYKVASKLAGGESLDEFHCELGFLAKLPGFHE